MITIINSVNINHLNGDCTEESASNNVSSSEKESRESQCVVQFPLMEKTFEVDPNWSKLAVLVNAVVELTEGDTPGITVRTTKELLDSIVFEIQDGELFFSFGEHDENVPVTVKIQHVRGGVRSIFVGNESQVFLHDIQHLESVKLSEYSFLQWKNGSTDAELFRLQTKDDSLASIQGLQAKAISVESSSNSRALLEGIEAKSISSLSKDSSAITLEGVADSVVLSASDTGFLRSNCLKAKLGNVLAKDLSSIVCHIDNMTAKRDVEASIRNYL